MRPSISSILVLADNPGAKLRQALGLASNAPLRIAYVPGPGDLHGTFEYWKRGEFDPRLPSIAYSTMFYELCRRLEAAALVVTRGGPASVTRDGEFRFENVPYAVPMTPLGYRLGRMRYVFDCRRALQRFRPHIVLLASDIAIEYLPWLKPRTARLVYTIHNGFWPAGTDLPVSLKRKARLFSFVDAVICVSNECQRQARALSPADLPSLVCSPQLREPPACAATPAPTAPNALIYLGRIERAKGVFELLDAFEGLTSSHPGLTLTYAGEGTALETLRAKIERRGLEGNVRVLGNLDAWDANKALDAADILVCPTQSVFPEGLAVVCLEAAARTVPSVMSSVVPAQELLAKSSTTYPADDRAALAAAIARLLDNPEEWRRRSVAAKEESKILYDRSQSWGSRLYLAMLAAASRTRLGRGV